MSATIVGTKNRHNKEEASGRESPFLLALVSGKAYLSVEFVQTINSTVTYGLAIPNLPESIHGSADS